MNSFILLFNFVKVLQGNVVWWVVPKGKLSIIGGWNQPKHSQWRPYKHAAQSVCRIGPPHTFMGRLVMGQWGPRASEKWMRNKGKEKVKKEGEMMGKKVGENRKIGERRNVGRNGIDMIWIWWSINNLVLPKSTASF